MAIARQKLYYDKQRKTQTGITHQNFCTYTLLPNEVARFEFNFITKQADNKNRASFTRTGLFYRDGTDDVKIHGNIWQTLETSKSHVTIEVGYTLNGDTIYITTKNADNANTQPSTWLLLTQKLVLS